MRLWLGLFAWLVLALALASGGGCSQRPEVVVGSKKFTESVLISTLVEQLLEDAGIASKHQRELGGTRMLWSALLAGDIDVYPEYTGTIRQEILVGEDVPPGNEALAAALARHGIVMSEPLGFNDTYAIGMLEETAEALGIRTLGDLARHPEVSLGLSHEFLDRDDGWPALRDRYRLRHDDVSGLDHEVAYRALANGSVQATDLYSTDAEILHYGLRVLEDDLEHFPAYDAVLLYRADLAQRVPAAIPALRRLEGTIDEREMIAMNARAVIDRHPDCVIAGEFLAAALDVDATCETSSLWRRLWETTREHLLLVGVSLLAALVVALPLGIVCAKRPWFGHIVLGIVGAIQTVPSLALLVLFIPLLGIGATPAIAAMFLFSLLPIVRNTATGLTDIPPSLRESAAALGLPPLARLRLVELPMASRAILGGIKTSAVINVSTATIGALIGAGGYGQPILMGIRLDDTRLILEGALPAMALAWLLELGFGVVERLVVPRGLRLASK